MPAAGNADLEGYDLDMLPATDSKQKSKKTVRLQYLAGLAVFLGFCLIGLSIYTGVMLSQSGEKSNICQSEDCMKTAASMMRNMDIKIAACDDFYDFACGGWPDNPMANSKLTGWTQFNERDMIRQKNIKELLKDDTSATKELPTSVAKAKSFYKTCLDARPVKIKDGGVSPIHDALSLVGLPTHVPQNWSCTPWYEQDARSRRMLDISALLKVRVAIDFSNHSRNILQVKKASLWQDKMFIKDVNQTNNSMLVWLNNSLIYLDPSADIKQLYDVNAFAKLFSELTPSNEPAEYLLHDCTIPESVQNFLKGYLDILFENTSVKLNLHEDRIQMDLPYLIQLSELLNNTNPLVVEKYMLYTVFLGMASNTLTEFGEVDCSIPTPRSIKCIEQVFTHFGYAVDYLYVKRHFQNFSREKVTEMIEDIREAFGNVVKSLDWLDEETRLMTLRKVKAIQKYVGFLELMITPGEIDKVYSTSEVVDGDFFGSYLKLKQSEVKSELESLRKEATVYSLLSGVASVRINAYYSADFNSIVIPAAILQRPSYDNGFEAINYGAIGSIIGHEITHGFDNKGRMFDEDGYERNWWSNATLQHFEHKAQCFMEQYNQYDVNGTQTLGENIADNGGLRAAFNAYTLYLQRNPGSKQERLPGIPQYDHRQLFFLGYAQQWCGHVGKTVVPDEHPPDKVRVIVTLKNFQEFADAWKCPAGSPMNPVHKCVLW